MNPARRLRPGRKICCVHADTGRKICKSCCVLDASVQGSQRVNWLYVILFLCYIFYGSARNLELRTTVYLPAPATLIQQLFTGCHGLNSYSVCKFSSDRTSIIILSCGKSLYTPCTRNRCTTSLRKDQAGLISKMVERRLVQRSSPLAFHAWVVFLAGAFN